MTKMKRFSLNSKGRLIKSDNGFSNKPYGTLNSCLNNELHLRTINANIGILVAMKEKKD
uniref:Uncharacterized protein n=1 Tax=Utricularia reniformis TaxID=192314 RepID=A0A1Y0B1Y7_9LAMI|nr:hypothetical protein AEK19_MT1240 [Utricularia reniformis]ART31452.1 hypothetical protein AEK19_MT1240 [Utricularia reniformis]